MKLFLLLLLYLTHTTTLPIIFAPIFSLLPPFKSTNLLPFPVNRICILRFQSCSCLCNSILTVCFFSPPSFILGIYPLINYPYPRNIASITYYHHPNHQYKYLTHSLHSTSHPSIDYSHEKKKNSTHPTPAISISIGIPILAPKI